MIAGTDVLVHTETLTHHALARLHRFAEWRFHPTLFVQRTLRGGDDDFGPVSFIVNAYFSVSRIFPTS